MNADLHELAPLLVDLGRAGIELAPHPTDTGRLRHRPADLPPDLSARLRIHREAVLGLLVNGYAPDPLGDTDAEYVLAERLGMADGLGMPTHPGSAAWLVAVGESVGRVDDAYTCTIRSTGVHCGHGKRDGDTSDGVGAVRPNPIRGEQSDGDTRIHVV